MEKFILFAKPWWVNIIIFIPFILLYFWRGKLKISRKTLLITAIFGMAFGFVEAAVVVYLRGAAGLLANIGAYQQSAIISQLPKNLLNIEIFREAATIIMLASVALLAVNTRRERWAVFFWTFAVWDIFYYAGLKATIGWPASLATADVLFLIPAPWFSQVWFPLLISILFALAVILGLEKRKQ